MNLKALIEIADGRSNLSLAAQCVYQANTLVLLKKLAHQNNGALVLELLRDPAKMAARYAQEYDELDDHSP